MYTNGIQSDPDAAAATDTLCVYILSLSETSATNTIPSRYQAISKKVNKNVCELGIQS